jgi:hypothetical protein
MLAGLGLLAFQLFLPANDQDEAGRFRRVVFPTKKKRVAPTAALGIEYHYDRNALVDSRLVAAQFLGLTASGNLVVFDAESFGLRGEKVLPRRATCLGPTADGRVLVGIANGCIVRIATPELAIDLVEEVPGVPRWIGRRAKGGTLVVAYQADSGMASGVRVRDEAQGRTYDVGARSVFFLDSQDRLWVGGGDRVTTIDLATGASTDVPWKDGWPGVRGFTELPDGQVWVFGGVRRNGPMSSYIARVRPGPKPTLLYEAGGKRQPPSAPTAPISHVVDDEAGARVIVVSHDSASLTDRSLGQWQSFDAMGGGSRFDDSLLSYGQAHRTSRGLVVTLARGGFMELTAGFKRRHVLEGQNPVSRPTEIVRLEKGMAFFGDGGPSFYVGGAWRALPDPVVPPAELMGVGRTADVERVWAAMLTIPLESDTSYVIAKAGAFRHYVGHIHGLRDTFLTARWDGKTLTVLGREDLPIEPADTFVTPDRHLWNVDDQGLWSFAGGRWQLVMRGAPGQHGGGGAHLSLSEKGVGRGQPVFRSAVGEPLHFAPSVTPPFFGLPNSASSWALVRLDTNEEGGVPLIDEVPVLVDGRRVLLHDLTSWENKKDDLLLATDHGLCVFNAKWGTCDPRQPEGLGGEVTLFARDGGKRLWLAGRGLWVLRDLKWAAPVHASIPVLADTRVVAMAEGVDGRMVIGLEDRGTLLLTLPEGWLSRPPDLPSVLAPWESTRPHEPSYQDPSLVLRECRDKSGPLSDAVVMALLADLRGLAEKTDPRVRVFTEAVFEGRWDIVVRGTDPEKLLSGVTPILEKHGAKSRFSLWKRRGARGSDAVQATLCPQP